MTAAVHKMGRRWAATPTNAQLMRLVRFPAIRRSISGALASATPEKVAVHSGGAYVRFRLADPRSFHPALFATIPVGNRGTLLVIGTPRSAVKKPRELEAFIRRMGRGIQTEARRSLIYQLRRAGIIGGSRTQAVLVPRSRVLSAARMYMGSASGRVAANPILATIGFNPDAAPAPAAAAPAPAKPTAPAPAPAATPAAKANSRIPFIGEGNVCYGCGKIIRGVAAKFTRPPQWMISRGYDFPKAWHPRCHDRAERAAGRELGFHRNMYEDQREGILARVLDMHRSAMAGEKFNTSYLQATRGLVSRDPSLKKKIRRVSPAAYKWLTIDTVFGQSNPLTTKESAELVGNASYYARQAKKMAMMSPRAASYFAGRAAGESQAVRKYGVKRSHRVADRIHHRAGNAAHLASVAANPGAVEINVPFRDGQKITPARMRAWIQSLPDNPITRMVRARFEQGLKQYKRFHMGSEPTSFTYRAIPMGSQGKRITDVDVVVSEGKEWAAPYQVPKSSGKYDPRVEGRYIHAHGESKMDIDIKKAAPTSKLPERFHTADGKFVGVVPSRNVTIRDWYRG
jgi:hypothetical protein